jgi:hypothetical protein
VTRVKCLICKERKSVGTMEICQECLVTKFPRVSALHVAENLRNAERVHKLRLTEVKLFSMGGTLGALFVTIVVASFLLWVTR